MVKFSNDYNHTFDKTYSPANIGISTPPMRDQIESLKARIFQGASKIELGFLGKEKGSAGQGQYTPEVYGMHEREALKLMAKVNDVTLSTHATPSMQGFAGITDKGFNEEQANKSLIEIKRTIDFAADVASGGPVVLHSGEFPMTVSQREPDKFEAFKDEEEKGYAFLADRETGQLVTLKKDMILPTPRIKDEYKNKPDLEKNGNSEIYVRDPETGLVRFDNKSIYTLMHEEGKEIKDVYKDFIAKEVNYNEGEAKRYAMMGKETEKSFEDVKNVIEGLKKINEKNPEYGREFAIEKARELGLHVPNRYSNDFKDYIDNPMKYIEKAEKQMKQQIDNYYEISDSMQRRSQEQKRQIGYTDPDTGEKKEGTIASIEDVGLERSAKTLAEAGIYAFEKSRKSRDDHYELKTEKPIFIAPENIFPETGYGGHPQELKELILKSREEMAIMLHEKKKISMDEAKKYASEHIKATFDIGHANTWKKYFKGTDEEFKKWLKEQVTDLNKAQIIGHVHISDNFGYYDEHVDPGQGNAPIIEFTKLMKESGYKGNLIVEPGAQDVRAWTAMLHAMKSPIYKIDGSSSSWTDIENSFVGQTYSPSYIVGEYAPDHSLMEEHKSWRFWSQTPIE